MSSRATRIAADQVVTELEAVKKEADRQNLRLETVEDALERIQQQLGLVTGVNLNKEERIDG